MKCTLSVIVPVYNSAPYLTRLFDSLKAQTWQDYELIVVNDGSTDTSEQIILEYSHFFGDRMVYCIQKNMGVAAARNTGLECASGQYISFIDSDDYVQPTFFERMLHEIYDSDIITCGVTVVQNGTICEHDTVSQNFTESGFDLARDSLQRKKAAHVLWNKIYKRELFDNFRFIEGYMFEDMYACAIVPLSANTVAYIDEELYVYCRREDSLSASVTDKKMADLAYLATKVVEIYAANGALFYLADALMTLVGGIIETICKYYVKDLITTSAFKSIICDLLATKKRLKKLNSR